MQESVAKRRTASPAKKAKAPAKRRKFRRILFFMFMFLLIAGGAYAYNIYTAVDKGIQNANDPYAEGTQTTIDPSYNSDKPLSVVILGRDTRKETGSLNTDVMIVAVIDPKTKQITMLSLPRDTRVKIPGYRGYHKINAVFANGEMERRQANASGQTATENGITLTKKTLQDILGIPIEHYIEVDFNGFKAVVDQLGGVEVNVDRRLVYDDPTDDTHIDLQPGVQELNGEQALGYVRHRHDNRGVKYFSNDFDRNRRQQEVIRAVLSKMTTPEGLLNLPKVIEVGSEYIHTDFSPEQIKGLAYDFKGLDMSNVTTLENGGYWNAATSYTMLPSEKRDEIRSALQTAMQVDSSQVADLNDSPFAGSSYEEAASTSSSSSKRSTKKKTVEQTPKEQPAETVENPQPEETLPPEQDTNTQPTEPTPAEPPVSPTTPSEPQTDPNNGGTTPPPDIVNEPPAEQDPSTTPPPDIVQPSDPNATITTPAT
ncbi:LCP family protein [Brevibacillus dissolubilis]|uniref:LCP family protein n=1 Tax=Brevibacillus dissolubilis TaxID=1844116 RepID=UPI0011168507|nr:LCP family protein [Brevibacillus dissolubilis]